ncbi:MULTISPECIES: 2-phospho-L-lactate transferase [Protofrankia]|uniref:LPPG:FO 2-phospho-L-lactate transferase n=2 Tax=Candidatus Protofrankia datiscae TaxID=2716812 RepID=F8AYS2_9ACTN|nr:MULTISPECIES: 2-phospho-L-lactate transferase [Protofrankia]AEH08579.1 LPPG:FO 2-phospho-L-lactate transferase [Candidatus Protofrankia datiscae]
MRITALAGGIGGSRFLLGVRAALPDADITVIGNTGDDITLHGLRICPDLDTVMYTLGGGISTERGWGRHEETFTVAEELAAYGVGPAWFGLGDRDLATHLVRTQMLAAGYSLTDVTAALCQRWQPGLRLLPMSDDRVETHVVVDTEQGRRAVHFQEWWLRMRAATPAQEIISVGAEQARPAPGVLDALADADVVLLPPSNPVVSIGSILAVPGLRAALVATPAPVVGVSPIIGGAPVRGMADACLRAIGVATTAAAVGAHYGARGTPTTGGSSGGGTDVVSADGGGGTGVGEGGTGAAVGGGILDGWLVDTADTGTQVPGVTVKARPLLMTDIDATVEIVRAALDLAGV